jgi:hypothetical protein
LPGRLNNVRLGSAYNFNFGLIEVSGFFSAIDLRPSTFTPVRRLRSWVEVQVRVYRER